MFKSVIAAAITSIIAVSAVQAEETMMVEMDGEMYTLTKFVEEEHHGWEFNVDGEFEKGYEQDEWGETDDYVSITPTISFTEGFTLTNGLFAEVTLTKGFNSYTTDFGADTTPITTADFTVEHEIFGTTFTLGGQHDFESGVTSGEFNLNKQF